ncbi:hypothetical protein Cni_G16768 [Canna indica]|uniref:MULE transposase domain-containing protein n=1 Tax=Canna indica TaxID=4628 RepID=A0AAQ3QCU7_9LILI|nr:hypothetical protein Cni_G16768 [Canna indica]
MSCEFENGLDEEYMEARTIKKEAVDTKKIWDGNLREAYPSSSWSDWNEANTNEASTSEAIPMTVHVHVGADLPPTGLNEAVPVHVHVGAKFKYVPRADLPPIGLNEPVVSDYESSDDEVITPETSAELVDPSFNSSRKKRRRVKLYNPKYNKKDISFEIGIKFESPAQFKEAVQFYALHNGVNLRWVQTCKERIEAKCVPRGVGSQMHCPWRIYGSWNPGETIFIIKSYMKEHKCSRSMTNRQTTVEWLANYYMEQFRQNPSWDVKLMAMDFQSKFYIPIARAKWYRVRSYALEKLRGSVEDHYALLGPYLAELRKKNPASLFNTVCDREFTGAPPIFKRLYIGFDALKKEFLHDCRPIIGFDGCFLKTFLGGQLLSVIGIDVNNQMFPIAWAVVEGENYDAWRWFLGLFFDNLEISQGYGWTFISDQQKAVRAIEESELNRVLTELVATSQQAHDSLIATGLKKNCQAHVSTVCKYDDVTN